MQQGCLLCFSAGHCLTNLVNSDKPELKYSLCGGLCTVRFFPLVFSLGLADSLISDNYSMLSLVFLWKTSYC